MQPAEIDTRRLAEKCCIQEATELFRTRGPRDSCQTQNLLAIRISGAPECWFTLASIPAAMKPLMTSMLQVSWSADNISSTPADVFRLFRQSHLHPTFLPRTTNLAHELARNITSSLSCRKKRSDEALPDQLRGLGGPVEDDSE